METLAEITCMYPFNAPTRNRHNRDSYRLVCYCEFTMQCDAMI